MKQGFFSRQDIGGEDPEKFRLQLQIANLKIINAEMLDLLEDISHVAGYLPSGMKEQIEAIIKKAKA